MNNKSSVRIKEILLLVSIFSMMGLVTIHAEKDSDTSKSAEGSGSDSNDQAGPSPEDEGDNQSNGKEKKSGGGLVPPDATVTSEASVANAVSASTGVYGDFNNDGFDDLAIGVPGEDVDNIVNAGAVNVLYGSATGLQALSPVNQYWHQDSPGVDDVPEDSDSFGSSLATGDFNNDGFDDLAIGVPREDVGAVVNAGAVNVLYGSATGLQTSAPLDQFWHQNTVDVEDTAEDVDSFGSSLATGDFNNDGRDDLAIGVPFESVGVGPIFNAGAVNVLYGSATGLQTASPLDQFWSQNTAGVEDTAEIGGDEFGSSLATGDFNNDGRDDLAIGVPSEDVGAVLNAGAVNVLYGSATGLQTASPLDQFWSQDSADVNDVAETNDFFGNSLATGDFNNDGRDDLAIQVRFEGVGVGPIFNAGAVNVLYGSATGLQTGAPADQFWSQDTAGVEDVAETNDEFGNSLATGDFNNDGRADLAIGVSSEDVGTFPIGPIFDAGAVNVLYGSATGLQTASPLDQFWNQDSADVEGIAEDSDNFGSALA